MQHQFDLSSDYIELYKLIKICGLAGSGGEAKQIIAGGLVRLNGEVTSQKRKKCKSGDVVELDAEKIVLSG